MVDIQHKDITGADAAHPPLYASESDPTTTLGAYRGWFKPSTGEAWIRNAANTDWISIAGGGGGGTVSAATEGSAGIAELATQGETDTGTDDGRIVTPLKAATRYLAKAGGTLTGFLTLHADPTSAMHPATKQYADALVSGGASPASESTAGIAELATQTETNTGTDDARIVTPLKLATRTSTETRAGVVELATDAETQTGTDTARAITPSNLSARSATETRSGVIEVATQAETNTGTDDGRAVTPLKMKTNVDLHINDTTDAHDASAISIVDSGTYFTSTHVEGALQELGASGGGGGVAALDDLTDVVITSPATDDVLVYNGTSWVNDTVPGGGGSGYRTLVTLGSDVANTTSAGFSDLTGLGFSVVADTVYRFEALVRFTVNATTVGAGWAVNGPTLTGGGYVVYHTVTPSTTSAGVEKFADSYDFGGISTSSASSTGSNIATIRGIVMPKASGTFILRFVVEAGGTLTAKAGSTLEYW